jgi:GNAT superfamily N-acetyltransferase
MGVRPLTSTDDRSRFASGDEDLDRFFHQYAGQNQFRHHIGATYVDVSARGEILGYATVSAGSLEIDGVRPDTLNKLPTYPLPILRLARLAVAKSAQGQGVGKRLLQFVLELALQMAEDVGCVGVVVDAKPGAVGFYAAFGFEELALVSGAALIRPQPIAMFLSVTKIQKAVG